MVMHIDKLMKADPASLGDIETKVVEFQKRALNERKNGHPAGALPKIYAANALLAALVYLTSDGPLTTEQYERLRAFAAENYSFSPTEWFLSLGNKITGIDRILVNPAVRRIIEFGQMKPYPQRILPPTSGIYPRT